MLNTHWEALPPPAVQLRRIGLVLGIPDTAKRVQTRALTPEEMMREALSAGLQVSEGRPDDPMLDLLDL